MTPLGKYASVVAAIVAVGLIGGYVVAVMFDLNASGLHDMALMAAGAVFGSAVGVNGWKGPVTALHARLDAQGVAAAAGAGANPP